MKVSYNWLKDYIDLADIPPAELAEKLTRSGVEVESVEARNKGVTGIVIGYVVAREKHPDADKLNVCQVDVGSEEKLQIVCGAPNVAAGQKVVVSVVGATLPGGLKIKKAKLRGVESQGMICSAKELGMNDKLLPKDQQEGIMVLSADAPVGQDAIFYLGLDDTILELGLTPNRSDCLSMMGVAYEVAAILGKKIELPSPSITEGGDSLEGKVQIKIAAPDHCTEYAARLISQVKLGPSPIWMQNRLMAAGIRPISNLVDITNYVMIELGQPLHAFDFSTVSNGTVVVRLAENGEKITTLDDVERTLDSDMLLITDGTKPIGIAGVMGGANSEVTSQTSTILLESAHFAGTSIRKTAKKLGLRSEASLRFEKEVDPQVVIQALDRAAQLMVELAGGTVSQGIVSEKIEPKDTVEIALRLERINGLLGTELTINQVEDIMNRLFFSFEKQQDTLHVSVPTRRQDITREVDLIEEVARLHGYDHIPTSLPLGASTRGSLTPFQKWVREIRGTLTRSGLYEVATYSFTNESILYDFASLSSETKGIPLSMPMSEERSHLRINLLPHLLQTAAYNNNRQNHDVGIFEMGRVFLSEEEQLTKLPNEHLHLAGLISGNWGENHWKSKAESVDFFVLKGVVESLLEDIGVGLVGYRGVQNLKGMHPGRTAEIFRGDDVIGYIGQVHPELQLKYDIKEAYVFNLDLGKLYGYVSEETVYQPLPKYPASSRDLSIVVDDQIDAGEVAATIKELGGQTLESVQLFDLYKGDRIGQNNKSMAFSLVYRNPEATLTDKEVNAVHEKIVEALANRYQAELRK
ncbi:MAG TPA: phenylalanine--tRNA ligase subunit beta [Bacillota bacterium]|nr:phenylalanine--tRNA ligase subunit beta [Bacillota bacterium]